MMDKVVIAATSLTAPLYTIGVMGAPSSLNFMYAGMSLSWSLPRIPMALPSSVFLSSPNIPYWTDITYSRPPMRLMFCTVSVMKGRVKLI